MRLLTFITQAKRISISLKKIRMGNTFVRGLFKDTLLHFREVIKREDPSYNQDLNSRSIVYEVWVNFPQTGISLREIFLNSKLLHQSLSVISSVCSSHHHARPKDKRQQRCSLWAPLVVWAPSGKQLYGKCRNVGYENLSDVKRIDRNMEQNL